MAEPVVFDARRSEQQPQDVSEVTKNQTDDEDKIEQYVHFAAGLMRDSYGVYPTQRFGVSGLIPTDGFLCLPDLDAQFGFGTTLDYQFEAMGKLDFYNLVTVRMGDVSDAGGIQFRSGKTHAGFLGPVVHAETHKGKGMNSSSGGVAFVGGALFAKGSWTTLFGGEVGAGMYEEATGDVYFDEKKQENVDVKKSFGNLFLGAMYIYGHRNRDGSFTRVVTIDGQISPVGWQGKTDIDSNVVRNGYLSVSADVNLLGIPAETIPWELRIGGRVGSQQTRYDPPMTGYVGIEYRW